MGATASRAEEYAATDDTDTEQLDAHSRSEPGLVSDDRNGSSLLNISATEFVWSFPAHSVYVTGAWDDWRVKAKLEPHPSETNHFTTVLALPMGTFQYKFIVDGNWKHSPALPTESDQHGNLNNVVTVKARVPEYDSDMQLHAEQLSTSPVDSYDFSILPQEDHTTEPPALPRLLASAPLDKLTDSTSSGTDFVRFNHMFATNCDAVYGTNEIRTIASELRYRSKVITTILITSKNKVPTQPPLRTSQAYEVNRTQPIPIGNQLMASNVQPMGESQSLILDALNNV